MVLSHDNNETLVRVGKGTSMGELFRRWWIPALLADELPGPDCSPVRVRILGEDLVAFRDSDSQVGFVDAYCPHRNAPMFFGRNEESGLRCIYHGWKFDISGACVDMPNCVEGADFKDRVRINAYPAWEGGGLVWLYMGPPDREPPKPDYEFLDVPPSHRYVSKYFINCNYLQAVENEFNDNHLPFLHSDLPAGTNSGSFEAITGSPELGKSLSRPLPDPARQTIVDTDFGQVSVLRGDDTADGQVVYTARSAFWLPFFSPAGGLNAPGVFNLNIRVPVDDDHIAFFRYKWSEQPISEKALFEMRAGGVEFPELIPGTFIPKQNLSNDYEMDRVRQRFHNFSGLVNVPVQDIAVLENQRGAVADRTRETLVSSDRYIVQARRRLLNLANALANGVEPTEPFRPRSYRFRPGTIEVDPGTPIEEAIKPLLEPWPHHYFDAAGNLLSEPALIED
jgi:phthalate 4,5-dioxygenase